MSCKKLHIFIFSLVQLLGLGVIVVVGYFALVFVGSLGNFFPLSFYYFTIDHKPFTTERWLNSNEVGEYSREDILWDLRKNYLHENKTNYREVINLLGESEPIGQDSLKYEVYCQGLGLAPEIGRRDYLMLVFDKDSLLVNNYIYTWRKTR